MHQSSIDEMRKFSARLPDDRPLKIADIGSRGDWNYRPIFRESKHIYLGLDLQPGPNVDLVLPDPYDWKNLLGDKEFDVVVSGQTLEHVARPFRFVKEMVRILKLGGLLCVIAPHTWDYHPSPLDCWRIYPDGMKAVLEDAGLLLVDVYMNKTDTVAVATKSGGREDHHDLLLHSSLPSDVLPASGGGPVQKDVCSIRNSSLDQRR